MTEEERFAAFVSPEPNSGCWLWMGCDDGNGYGMFRPFRRRMVKAHRFSYALHCGPIPADKILDHLCRVRCCVNPKHLEPVSYQENAQRGLTGINSAAKTHCPQGHPYSGLDNRGKRICRQCMNERQRGRNK